MESKRKIALVGSFVLLSAAASFVLLDGSLISSTDNTLAQGTQEKVPSAAGDSTLTAENKLKSLNQSPIAQAVSAEPNRLSTAEILQLKDTNPDYLTVGDRMSEVSARRNGDAVDVEALYAATKQANAWKPSDQVPAGFPLSLEEQLDGREFIQINPMKIESLVPGDTLDIDIAQINGSFTAVIEEVKAQQDSVTWVGHLQNVEGESQVVFTRGDSLIIGGITTPNGHFEMEARGEHGWIANSATLFKTPDVLVEVPSEELRKTPATLSAAPDKENIL